MAGGTSAESEAASQPAASDSVLVSPKRHTSRRIKARPAVEEQAPETEPEEADTEE